MTQLSILIVDENCLYRDTLAQIMLARPEVGEVRTAKDAASVRVALGVQSPGVVLLSLTSPGSTQLLGLIRSTAPASRLIVMGASEDAEDEIVRCAEAGVAGYLLRSESLDRLIALIGSVAVNETLCSPKVAAVLLRRISALTALKPPAGAEPPPIAGSSPVVGSSPVTGPLTPREREIRELLELGLSNREIADRLFIEVRTVKNHVHNILAKLGVRRRYQTGVPGGYQAGPRRVPAEVQAGPR